METIISTQNRLVKLARSLAQRKFRALNGLFLVEGVNLLRDMPTSVVPEFVFTTKERATEAEKMFGSREGSRMYLVSDAVMESIADTATPYGIVAVCKLPSVEFALPHGNALLLDGVSDPGNIGTILRTAAACDFCEVYALDTADIYSPKVIRATLGGIFKVRVCEVNEEQALSLVGGTDSAVLDMDGECLLNGKVQGPILFVAGSEAHGVRDSIKKAAKRVYSLPMKNQIESLNVAVATAVAMYQTV